MNKISKKLREYIHLDLKDEYSKSKDEQKQILSSENMSGVFEGKQRSQGNWSKVTMRVIEHEFREVERDQTT